VFVEDKRLVAGGVTACFVEFPLGGNGIGKMESWHSRLSGGVLASTYHVLNGKEVSMYCESKEFGCPATSTPTILGTDTHRT